MFLENENIPVLCLPKGMWIEVENGFITLKGSKKLAAILHINGKIQKCRPKDDLAYLFDSQTFSDDASWDFVHI